MADRPPKPTEPDPFDRANVDEARSEERLERALTVATSAANRVLVLEQELSRLRQQITVAKAELLQTRAELAEARADLGSLLERNSILAAEIVRAKIRIRELEKELSSIKTA